MGLLKILLIIVFIYYLFRLTARFVFPFLLKYFIGKTQRDFSNRENGYEKRHRKKEGEVSIDYIPKKDKKRTDFGVKDTDDQGDYVDFEEVE